MINIEVVRSALVFKYMEAYMENTTVGGFFRSMFAEVEGRSRIINVNTRRISEGIATEVNLENPVGNYNSLGKGSESFFIPFAYDEYIVLNQFDFYDRVFGTTDQSDVSMGQFDLWMDELTMAVEQMTMTIERAFELQAKQVLTSGIITPTKLGIKNIDFQRKGDSKVTLSGTDRWTVSGVDPKTSLRDGCQWIVDNGRVNANGRFVVIMGAQAFQDFLSNEQQQKQDDLKSWDRTNLMTPMAQSDGGAYHGYTSCGSFVVDIFTYNSTYDHPTTGVTTQIMDIDKIIILPENPKFELRYGLVDIIDQQSSGLSPIIPVSGKMAMYDFANITMRRLERHVVSSGICVPVQVDAIYTLTLATA